MGIPLPQPTSRTREPSGIDDARAVASGTPVSSTLSDAYHSAIRSYSRILNQYLYTPLSADGEISRFHDCALLLLQQWATRSSRGVYLCSFDKKCCANSQLTCNGSQ